MALLFIAAWMVTPLSIQAASVQLTPQLYLNYTYNDNVLGVDVKDVVPTKVQYVTILVGLESKYKFRHLEIGTSGSLGYTDYLDALIEDGEHLKTKDLNDLAYFRASGKAWISYTGRVLSLDLEDAIVRTRSLSDVYGPQTDALSNYYLYTDNIASIQVRLKISPKTRVLLKYSIETLIFPLDGNPTVSSTMLPLNSTEHRGYVRSEYDFSGKNTGFIDVQGGQRNFDTRKDVRYFNPTTGNWENVVIDYNFLQILAGLIRHLNDQTDLEAGIGANTRQYFMNYDYPSSWFGGNTGFFSKDYGVNDRNTNPLARVTLTHTRPDKLRLTLEGEYAASTYGQNSFFDYINGKADLKYNFTRKISANLNAIYTYNLFDLERNFLQARIWKHDRVDNIFVGRVALNWDLVQKNKQTWLGVGAGYEYKNRNSSLNNWDDFVGATPTNHPAYLDTDINMYFAEINFLPMILIGR